MESRMTDKGAVREWTDKGKRTDGQGQQGGNCEGDGEYKGTK